MTRMLSNEGLPDRGARSLGWSGHANASRPRACGSGRATAPRRLVRGTLRPEDAAEYSPDGAHWGVGLQSGSRSYPPRSGCAWSSMRSLAKDVRPKKAWCL